MPNLRPNVVAFCRGSLLEANFFGSVSLHPNLFRIGHLSASSAKSLNIASQESRTYSLDLPVTMAAASWSWEVCPQRLGQQYCCQPALLQMHIGTLLNSKTI
jgi:hypothetical protein